MALVAAVAPEPGLEIRLSAAFITSIAVHSLRPFLGYALGIDLVIGLTIGLVVGLGLHPVTLILRAAALAHDPEALRSSIVGLTRAIALGYPNALFALPPALALGLLYALVRHGASPSRAVPRTGGPTTRGASARSSRACPASSGALRTRPCRASAVTEDP